MLLDRFRIEKYLGLLNFSVKSETQKGGKIGVFFRRDS